MTPSDAERGQEVRSKMFSAWILGLAVGMGAMAVKFHVGHLSYGLSVAVLTAAIIFSLLMWAYEKGWLR